jgi:cytochrome b subunit of formate dehydrogenase
MSLRQSKTVTKKMFPLHLFLTLLTIGLVILPSKSNAQSVDDCLSCHNDRDLTMDKKGKKISLFVDEKSFKKSIHSKIGCISCHKGFNADELPHAEKIVDVNCVSCHSDAITKHNFHPQILFKKGMGITPDISCKSCHGIHDIHLVKNSQWSRKNIVNSCGTCHPHQKEEYNQSNHFSAKLNNGKDSPDCLNCHSQQITKSSFKDNLYELKIAQEKLCLSCHLDNPEVKRRVNPKAKFIQAYNNSVHGAELHGGNAKSANCVDCHSSHKVLISSDSRSDVNRLNIPATCGSCHSEILKDYNASIHGTAVSRGNIDSPVCTSCHGEHNILESKNPQSPVAFRNVSSMVCAPCHTSVRLSERYDFPTNSFETFTDSYHGLALRGGSTTVANCGSCHGHHNIKPSSDPTSTIHKNNLVKTCGSCHPGANNRFVSGTIHTSLEKNDEPILYWIATIYIILIVSIVGGMLIHNAFDLYRKAKLKKQLPTGVGKNYGHSLYLRMTLNERLQHATMAISFIILVITGFMLRYPESWWVNYIKDLSSDAFEYRSLIHRIAAIAMILICLYHIYYIIFTKRGRQLIIDLLPRFKDIVDAIGVAKFNLGITNEKPKLDRFSYIEKAEYWALIWGTIVMSITGLLMWIYTDIPGSFTKLEWDIARTIHYYEAWLAFLAIIVWHIYFVIFNPDVYPMNLAWLKGTLTEEEMAHEHPLELERLKKQENSNTK